jgi:biopolymer transport protein ExbB
MQFLIDAFRGPGAAFMYAITAVMAFGLAVLVERSWAYWRAWRGDDNGVQTRLNQGDLDGAAHAAGNHPMAQLIRAGAGATGGDAAWDAMAAESALVESAVRGRVDYLATVGNISTMLGLLGTVYGLIFSFSSLSDGSAVERATRLSDGISAAMATTAWGLMVGIPALALHSVLTAKAGRILAQCESAAARVALARRRAA